MRLRPPGAATLANVRRNAAGEAARAERWRPARDALWALLEPRVPTGARVGVVGAGNAHDLPLTRLAGRCGQVTLLDLDPGAAGRAREREPAPLRERVRTVRCDVTDGAADRIVRAAATGAEPRRPLAPSEPLPGAPYDAVVGDLLYSQLLFPGLLDAGVTEERLADALERAGPPLTRSVVARLHASLTPTGCAVHVHDPLAWWDGHEQPFPIEDVLAAADTGAALALVERGVQPTGCDVRAALAELDREVLATAFWRWPFQPGVDYLVCATVAR